MSSAQTDSYALGATQITLGVLSGTLFPTLIKSPSLSGGRLQLQTLGAGATVQILPLAMAGATVGGATQVGASLIGWPLVVATPVTFNGPAAFYLACTGATSIVSILFDYSAGATLA